MDVFAEIDGYKGQTLLLHGTKDKIVDIAYARKAKEHFPQCRYAEIVGGEHFFRGKAEKTARAYIREFMRL
jgi:alpha/beta superfamily hydrolase